jgi:hypothetical protein
VNYIDLLVRDYDAEDGHWTDEQAHIRDK